MTEAAKPKILKTRVTLLEMTNRPVYSIPTPASFKLAIMSAKRISLPLYRFLYFADAEIEAWL